MATEQGDLVQYDDAFQHFLTLSRETHEELHPAAKIDEEQFKSLAMEKWASCKEEEKARFAVKITKKRSDSPLDLSLSSAKKVCVEKNGCVGGNTAKPKKALTPYVIFMRRYRDTVRAERPGIKAVELPKLLREKWENLDVEAKKPFEQQAGEDRKRFQREMALFRQGMFGPEALPKVI